MAEETCQAQLIEAVANLCGEMASLKEEQGRQRALMENVLHQLSSLAVNYDNLAQLFSRIQPGEGSSGGDNMKIASFHMEGKALSWYSWLMESCPMTNWEEFLIAFKIRLGPSAYEDPVGAFTKLIVPSTLTDRCFSASKFRGAQQALESI